MHIIEIPEINQVLYLPEDLSECDTRQYIEMCTLIFLFQSNEINFADFCVYAVYKLLKIKRVESKDDETDKFANIYQISLLIDTFFETSEDNTKIIKQNYLQNHIPIINGFLKNYYGPLDNFENIKFGEYLDALDAFINFNQTGELEYMYQLLAIMYRKKAYFSKLKDKRQPYISDTVDKRLKFLKHQPIGVVYGFYLFFASYQQYISNAVIFVQGNEIDFSVLFDAKNSGPESNLPGLGMKSVLLNLAESGVYGDESGVRNTPFIEVLLRMYDITKKNADQEIAQKQAAK